MVAFLRQSVLPFARWEERQPGGCEEVAEDTAFEHAFLAAEIDRLGAAVAALEGGTPRERAAGAAAALRQVHRLEAVLERHVHKAEERETLFPPAPETTPPAAASAAVREMTPAEVQRFLREREWGL